MGEMKQMRFAEVTRVIDRIVDTSIEDLMHGAMMPYSEYVILDRALPRVEDGLKPVQRRILYTMLELGLTPDKPHKKSARIVGDCLGKYHPHGDSSVYGAMVRMAQDFNMGMLLVDGHGNYGSVDGDSPAAMRYTEARLSPLAVEMLRDIDKDTVRWAFNFDDSLKEPEMLPSRFPNILINGASGIAIGLATNIPPHNLSEVIDGIIELINNPKMNLESLMKHIKAPDFPTGGHIIVGEGLLQAYETGNGKIKLRAKTQIEKSSPDKYQIVITEIPYQVNKAALLTSIIELKEDKKYDFSGIQDVVDESDRRGMRAVVKLKKDTDPNMILKGLYLKTKMEISYGINMVAIAGGRPQLMGLIPMLKYYIEYQRNIVLKRTQFDLAAAKKREEILNGLYIAIQNIDEVIAIIKAASSITDAKNKLRERFLFSELQANAIIEMKLGRLTNLEINKLIEELKRVKELIKELSAIVGSKARQLETVIRELKDIKKRFKIGRRSNIIAEECDDYISLEDVPVNGVNSREGIVIVCPRGNIKLIKERSYQLAEKNALTLQEHCFPCITIRLDKDKDLIAFTNMGNAVRINPDMLPEKRFSDKGEILKAICPEAQEKEEIIKLYNVNGNNEGALYFMSRQGYIKKSMWSEYSVNKEYFQAVVLNEGDRLINVEDEAIGSTVMCLTRQGICLNYSTESIPIQGRRSMGVKGISLNEGDSVKLASQSDGSGEMVIITDLGYSKRVICASVEMMKRYRKGITIYKISEKIGNEIIYANIVKKPYDLAIFTSEGEIKKLSTEDIPLESKQGKGKQLIKKTKVLRVLKQAEL